MIYLDTCLLIYLLEDRAGRGSPVERRMRAVAGTPFAVSPLVRMECLVKPLRDGDVVLQRRYERLAGRFVLLPLEAAAFDQAAVLRARFGLRTPDALHLACAQLNDCTALWTNDRRLEDAARGLSVSIVGE